MDKNNVNMDKNKRKLRKELSLLNLVIIGIVGSISTGIFFSSAGMAVDAGPALILGWILGAIFYFFIGLTYVPLALSYPEAGGPSRYSIYSHGKVANMINAFSDLIWYIFIPPIEAIAVVYGLNFLTSPHLILVNQTGAPTTYGALVGVLIILLFIPFNYFSVKFFGQSTSTLGIIKMFLYLAVGFGFVFLLYHPQNFTAYGGFAPFGYLGILPAMPLALYSFGSIRVIPDYAEESKNHKVIGKAIIYSIIGQTLVYLLFATAFVGSIDWKGLGYIPGDWASLSHISGNPFVVIAGTSNAPSILLLITIITAIFGPFVTGYIYLGGGMRVLFAMARSNYISEKVKELNQYSVPLWALIIFSVVSALIVYLSAPIPTIYGLISDAVAAGYLGFASAPVALISLKKQGKLKEEIIPFSEVLAPLAFIFASLIVFWSGWPSVPYVVLFLAVISVVFSVIYKIKENIKNALWYIGYVVALLIMSYIGGDGALNIINFYYSTVIVAVLGLIFYGLGVYSRLKE